MRLFWWQQLPLLILIQLLQPNCTSHKLYAEALLACKSTLGSTRQFSGGIGSYPFLRRSASGNCYKLNNPGVVSLFPRSHPLYLQGSLVKLSPFAPNFISSNSAFELQEKLYLSSNRRITATVDGDNGVPTLTPWQEAEDKKPSKQRVAAIVGGVGATLLVIVIVLLVYICLMRVKKFIRRTSDAASSAPSPPMELERGNTSHYAVAMPSFDAQSLRQLTITELEHATCNFSQSNIIGEGAFGLVYKGLLQDGSIVAIKRHLNKPIQTFFGEVKHIALVHHKHLVKLIGYCEDRHQQILVYDYISNGNVGNYLYDSDGLPIGKLDLRQRLLIALGAAKALQHLHSLVPPLLHMHFRTSNVLVGENFTAKVSDYGLSKMLTEGHRAGSSSAIDCFLDPELNLSKNFSEQNDVYSFGVFLLELISGHEANEKNQLNSEHNLVLQAKNSSLSDFVDKTLGEQTMHAAKQMMELALLCVDTGIKRPSMVNVVQEIEQIQTRDMGHLHSELGEEIGAVTLGSELFQ